MKKRVIVVDAYRKNPTLITVLVEHANGAVHGDDKFGIRHYATKDRILKIPIPSK